MVIVETTVFTRRVEELLPDEEYQLLQAALVARPELGKVIPRSGGLRKLRWAPVGRGKRGGVRVIYYWAAKLSQILMLYLFAKNERDDLSAAQLKKLRQIVEEEYP
jgi:mRNA-degrading endonuclease RelE of RelBE toxin-antitoxin system